MRTIFAEYNPQRNSIDVYTSAGYMLRIDCWEAEKNLTTTPGSDCALNALAIDEPLEYARLYLDGTMQMWIRSSIDLPFSNCCSSSVIRCSVSAIAGSRCLISVPIPAIADFRL